LFFVVGEFRVFRRFFSKNPEPLSGAPAVRRLKTYSAQSGYVYHYFYEGQRPYSRDGESGTEFVFTISADRKNWHAASVLLAASAVADWQRDHSRELSSTEHYAVCKMALFQAFDERATPHLMKHEIRVRRADLDGIIESLDL
jgi:hypothetical protein